MPHPWRLFLRQLAPSRVLHFPQSRILRVQRIALQLPCLPDSHNMLHVCFLPLWSMTLQVLRGQKSPPFSTACFPPPPNTGQVDVGFLVASRLFFEDGGGDRLAASSRRGRPSPQSLRRGRRVRAPPLATRSPTARALRTSAVDFTYCCMTIMYLRGV